MRSPKQDAPVSFTNKCAEGPKQMLSAIPSPPRSSNTAVPPPVTAPRNTKESKTKPLVVTPENDLAPSDKNISNASNKSSPMYPPLRPPRGKHIPIPTQFRSLTLSWGNLSKDPVKMLEQRPK